MPGIDIPDDGASTATVNSKMTAIADAIREKTGESGTLTLDAMAAAIEALEVGGGAKVACGTFTLAQDYSTTGAIEVTHNLGVVPDFAIVTLCGVQYSKKEYEVDTVFGRRTGTSSVFGGMVAQKNAAKKNNTTADSTAYYFRTQSDSGDYGIDHVGGTYNMRDASETSFVLSTSSNSRYYSGRTYFWLAVGGIA